MQRKSLSETTVARIVTVLILSICFPQHLLSVDLTLVSLSMSPDLLSNCFLENAGLYECFGSLDLVLFI